MHVMSAQYRIGQVRVGAGRGTRQKPLLQQLWLKAQVCHLQYEGKLIP